MTFTDEWRPRRKARHHTKPTWEIEYKFNRAAIFGETEWRRYWKRYHTQAQRDMALKNLSKGWCGASVLQYRVPANEQALTPTPPRQSPPPSTPQIS